ncbi:MAG: hypothetical protein ABFD91_06890 [Anaerohalosphaeraceae bacterium]
MNTKWVGIVLLSVIVSSLSLAAETRNYTPSYLKDGIVGNVINVENPSQKYPQWQFGAAGSTWQDWTVNETELGLSCVLTQFKNPYAIANNLVAQITDFGDLGVEVSVPNIQSNEKIVWFEVVYKGIVQYDWVKEGVMLYTGTITDEDGNRNPIAVGVNQIYFSSINQLDFDGHPTDWKVMTIGWTIKPSPSAEWFTFYVFDKNEDLGAIQSISIDTLSAVVPAPGAVVLAGLGAAIVGYFRRKY